MHTCFGGVPDGDSFKNSFKNIGKYNRSLCVQMGLASKRMLIAIFVTHTCFGCAPDGDSFKIIQHPCRQEVLENTSVLFACTWGWLQKQRKLTRFFIYVFLACQMGRAKNGVTFACRALWRTRCGWGDLFANGGT